MHDKNINISFNEFNGRKYLPFVPTIEIECMYLVKTRIGVLKNRCKKKAFVYMRK